MGADQVRKWISSGLYWEEHASYARAVRVGNHIWVSGTTATETNGRVITDPAEQTLRAIDEIDRSLKRLGSSLQDVVLTRMYVSSLANIRPIALAHGERFKDIRPANMLLECGLSQPILVEIEAEAIVGSGYVSRFLPE
jgi:enamine deaminase RidA (YjgF/YER057c/UK114 family)